MWDISPADSGRCRGSFGFPRVVTTGVGSEEEASREKFSPAIGMESRGSGMSGLGLCQGPQGTPQSAEPSSGRGPARALETCVALVPGPVRLSLMSRFVSPWSIGTIPIPPTRESAKCPTPTRFVICFDSVWVSACCSGKLKLLELGLADVGMGPSVKSTKARCGRLASPG
jgi:hypothetical protein